MHVNECAHGTTDTLRSSCGRQGHRCPEDEGSRCRPRPQNKGWHFLTEHRGCTRVGVWDERTGVLGTMSIAPRPKRDQHPGWPRRRGVAQPSPYGLPGGCCQDGRAGAGLGRAGACGLRSRGRGCGKPGVLPTHTHRRRTALAAVLACGDCHGGDLASLEDRGFVCAVGGPASILGTRAPCAGALCTHAHTLPAPGRPSAPPRCYTIRQQQPRGARDAGPPVGCTGLQLGARQPRGQPSPLISVKAKHI